MEPVFMILGQSSATAASLALDENLAVKQVDFAKLRARLLADKQVTEYAAPPKPSAKRAKEAPPPRPGASWRARLILRAVNAMYLQKSRRF